MALSTTNAGNSPTSCHTAAASHSSDSSSSRTASPRRASAATVRALGDAKPNSTAAYFCCPFVTVVVTGTAIFLHFFRTPADTFSTDQPPYAHHGKIEALLQMLWLTGNSTLDPCKDFYRYACYNYIAVHQENAYFNGLQAPNLVLQGLSTNPAGRALFTYHRSCLLNKWSPIDTAKDAVRALLQVLYISSDMTSLRMFALILKLNLLYGVHTDPLIYQNFHGRRPAVVSFIMEDEKRYGTLSRDGAQDLFLVAGEYDICAEDFNSAVIKKIYTAGLTELATLNVNVTFIEVAELVANFCSVVNSDPIEGNASILGNIVEGVSARLWKDTVEGYTGTAIRQTILRPSADVLKHRFALLTDSSVQPVATALVVAHAGFVLAAEGAEDDVGLIGHYEFCTESSYDLYPLWILNHIISFAAQSEHNGIVTGIFDTLVDVIGTEIDETRPTQLHFSVSALLKKIRLLLPYHIYPSDTVIPRLEGNFFKNILKIREHRLDSYSYKAPSGIPRKISVLLRSRHIMRSGCYIVLPLLVYSAATMLHTMAVLPTAVLGLIIADSLWTLVLRTNLTAPRDTSAHNFSCSNQDNVYLDLSGPAIKHPALAVRSTVRALRTKDWHKKRIYWGQWRTSMSQIFYRLLLLFYYCGERGDASFLKEQVASIQSDVADFSESFGC